MKKLTFITGNKKKAQEVSHSLDISIEILDIDLEELQGNDLEKIAKDKVTRAYNKLKKPVFIDDVGFYVEAWNGFPGPLIKWILKLDNGNAKVLLKMLEGVKNRKATGSSVIAYHDGKKVHTFMGSINGRIIEEIRGKKGFGWDAVFIPDGSDKTFDEMSLEEKSKISHRAKSIAKFKKFLDGQNKKNSL